MIKPLLGNKEEQEFWFDTWIGNGGFSVIEEYSTLIELKKGEEAIDLELLSALKEEAGFLKQLPYYLKFDDIVINGKTLVVSHAF